MSKKIKQFKSTHSLPFLMANWDVGLGENMFKFKIGTCEGLYQATKESYIIIAILNNKSGNGHLEDVFEWFENSCIRDGKTLKVVELLNKRFEKHLIEKRGFKGNYNLEKTF